MKGIVYQIEINKYKYIGSTHNLEERFYHHKNLLVKNNHYNKFLQRVYNKYNVINVSILYEYDNREDAYSKEQELLDQLYKRPNYMMEHPKAIGGSLPGELHPLFGKKRPNHSKWMKENNPGKYVRTSDHIDVLRNSRKDMVTCKDKNNNTHIISKSEFDLRDDLVGITSGVDQPKLRKHIKCIEDNIIFESIKQASEFYNSIGSSNIIKSIKNDKPIGRKKLNRLLTFCYI
jgi:predicted GIY-YIG superfamily endonuclease